MHFKNSLVALLVAKASAIALPQVEAVEVHDPVADAIAAYEEAIDVPVPQSEIVTPSANTASTAGASEAIKAAIADAVAGGLERRGRSQVRELERRGVRNLSPLVVPGFDGPDEFGDATIIAPKGDTTYMGVQTFPQNTGYNPNVCAEACKAKSAYNVRQAKAGVQPRICRFFVAYTVLKDGGDPLFTCTYYTQPWDRSFATNRGSTRSGVKYTNQDSNGYTLIETKEQCVTTVTSGSSYENQGLAFRVYDQPVYSDNGNNAFSADYIFGRPSEHTGVTDNLSWQSQGWPNGPNGQITIGDYSFRSDTKSVLAQGFFTAPSSGPFKFSLSEGKDDNYARVWVGDKAYTSWNEANADQKVTFNYNKIGTSELISTTPFTFTKGQIYPITFLWANGGTQAQSFLKITDSAGNDVSTGNFARPCDVTSVFPLPSGRLRK
ncbi:Putative PA14/GLEYA domain-containing protein [Septoria linicola]|uniref:PA14/GLEYA domain-containing protein n=1 Tax=Septoria linicola TaxID=215465 RepID=A0A9Q9AVZ8_9PEZI|nr:Putative PA14/GLEYA domain-containing protein [Septoria linicola]